MGTAKTRATDQELTEEQREQVLLDGLIAEAALDDGLRQKLAYAWRLGFSRAMRLNSIPNGRGSINPFW